MIIPLPFSTIFSQHQTPLQLPLTINILLLSKLDPEKHKSWSSSRASGPLHRHNKELPSLLLQYFYCHHPNLRSLTQAWIIMKHLESNLPASNKQAMSRHFLQNAFQIQDSTFNFTFNIVLTSPSVSSTHEKCVEVLYKYWISSLLPISPLLRLFILFMPVLFNGICMFGYVPRGAPVCKVVH